MPPRLQPGNPLWIEWLEELQFQHEQRGAKTASAYKRAAYSFKRCPIEYKHPQDSIELKDIGPYIVKFLTNKLLQHCKATNQDFPQPTVREPAPKRVRANAAKTKASTANKDSSNLDHDDVEQEETEEDRQRDALRRRILGLPELVPPPQAVPAQTPRTTVATAKKTSTKQYVPGQGTGAYAILLALYKLSTNNNEQDYRDSDNEAETTKWILKNQIVDVGSEYSNTPFDQPTGNRGAGFDPGAGYRSAWSGMTTLRNKELVKENNKRPKGFALTATGFDLAETLAQQAGIPVVKRRNLQPMASTSVAPGQLGTRIVMPQARPLQRVAIPATLAHSKSNQGLSAREIEDAEYEKELALALERSAQESGPSSTGPREDFAFEGSTHARPMQGSRGLSGASSSSSPYAALAGSTTNRMTLDGRKAASGYYADYASRPSAAAPAGNVDSVFGFFYLDSDDNRTRNKNEAEQGMEESTMAAIYRIEYKTSQDLHNMAKSILRKSPLIRSTPIEGGSTMSGFLRERIAIDVAPGFPTTTTGTSNTSMLKDKGKEASIRPVESFTSLMAGFKAPTKRSKDAMYALPAVVEERRARAAKAAEARNQATDAPASAVAGPSRTLNNPFSSSPPAINSSVRGREDPARGVLPSMSSVAPDTGVPPSFTRQPVSVTANSAGRPIVSTSASTSKLKPVGEVRPTASTSITRPIANAPSKASRSSTKSIPVAFTNSGADVIVNRHPLDPILDHVVPRGFMAPTFRPRLLLPGTFKIMLIVDTREIGHHSRDLIPRELKANGVDVGTKMLPLGDMIWVARPVDAFGVETGEDDIVLDAIVERKRLDDLCKSVLDNRYMNQKIRMRESGITQRIYLIEKYDAASQYAQFGKQIWTCKSQLQINDGFYVHESKSLKDTIAWLKLRTQIMTELYANMTLYVLPNDIVDRSTYLALQAHLHRTQPNTRYLTTYFIFNELNKTDSGLTLKTQWAQMVSKINGVSAEKTVQFVERWSTPVQFWQETKRHRETFDENQDGDDDDVGGGGGGGGVKGKKKKRKIEDFVIDNIADIGQRGIKGRVGSRIWSLFASETYEANF
ncbi:Crossover junction endonuclease mus81 [Microbotryomycetes sp. JL221]|nr:Crossover junction endonuclease mus81 [Microbotryomycetes sp. JL221]